MATSSSPAFHWPYAIVSIARFHDEFVKRFSGDPRFRPASVLPACRLVEFINRDPHVADLRWAAYMLATVTWETTTLVEERRQIFSLGGRPAVDGRGKPVFVARRRWEMAMSPTSEIGRGRTKRYGAPCKVFVLPDGSVRLTEEDGDQFKVLPNGQWFRLSKFATMGVAAGTPRSQTYLDDEGAEQYFYGRGYVQLTWWEGYAKGGVAIGRGLDLLENPELANDPEMAYAIMSTCMRTGAAFAHGRRLGDYLCGARTDYLNARRIVNGLDKAQAIADLAQAFQDILVRCTPARFYPYFA
jgi:hypothetical protein